MPESKRVSTARQRGSTYGASIRKSSTSFTMVKHDDDDPSTRTVAEDEQLSITHMHQLLEHLDSIRRISIEDQQKTARNTEQPANTYESASDFLR